MATMTQVYREARLLSPKERARLVAKLIATDLPEVITPNDELARREDEVRNGKVQRVEVSSVMKEARSLAGIGSKPALLKKKRKP